MQNMRTKGGVAGDRFALSEALSLFCEEKVTGVCSGHLIESEGLGFYLTTGSSASLVSPQA